MLIRGQLALALWGTGSAFCLKHIGGAHWGTCPAILPRKKPHSTCLPSQTPRMREQGHMRVKPIAGAPCHAHGRKPCVRPPLPQQPNDSHSRSPGSLASAFHCLQSRHGPAPVTPRPPQVSTRASRSRYPPRGAPRRPSRGSGLPARMPSAAQCRGDRPRLGVHESSNCTSFICIRKYSC